MRIILETAEPYSIQCVKEKRENAWNIVVGSSRLRLEENRRLKIEVGGRVGRNGEGQGEEGRNRRAADRGGVQERVHILGHLINK